MRYTYMYSDAAGESHFEDVEVTMAPGPNLPPAIPALLSDGWPAGRVRFLEFPPGLASGTSPLVLYRPRG